MSRAVLWLGPNTSNYLLCHLNMCYFQRVGFEWNVAIRKVVDAINSNLQAHFPMKLEQEATDDLKWNLIANSVSHFCIQHIDEAMKSIFSTVMKLVEFQENYSCTTCTWIVHYFHTTYSHAQNSTLHKPYVNGATLKGKFLILLSVRKTEKEWARSFQRGTVSLCRSKGCKFTVHQTLRMIKIIQNSNLACTCLVRLRPSSRRFCQISYFDIQRHAVPL